MKKVIFIFTLITLVSFLVRFWDYPNTVNFHLDPPLFFNEVKDMVDQGKIRLIGPMVASKVIDGRWFFTGPTFYYFLVGIGLFLNWNVLLMTSIFAFIWLIIFILIFLWLKLKYGLVISLIVYALVSFFPLFVPFSRIVWNPTFIPLLALLFFIFLEKKEKSRIYYLLIGLTCGLGLSIHYGAVLWAIPLLFYFYKEIKEKKFVLTSWLLIIFGLVIAELPIIIFEFKHDFYNLRTIFFHIQNYQPSATYEFNLLSHSYYYVFPFLPVICLVYANLLKGLEAKIGEKKMICSQIFTVCILLIRLVISPRDEALINPTGWTVSRQQNIAQIIDKDAKSPFEVAAVVGPDTRVSEIRWWLRMKNHNPLGVEDYEKTDVLYLVAPLSRPPEKETVWEVNVLRPFNVERTWELGSDLFLYKLVRVPKVSPTR